MTLQMRHLDLFISSAIWIMLQTTLCDKVKKDPAEYCQSENFQPKCSKNEVILMTTAVYGRLRIGKCVKAEEVAAQKMLAGDDSRFLGCSADVLHILDRRCSGKMDCDIRISTVSFENINPCFPGLNVHLEASYDCISVVDEKRSCAITISKDPVHMLSSSDSPSVCGTRQQPWMVEAPVGQKVMTSLLDITAWHSDRSQVHNGESCRNLASIVDKSAKRNVSICEEREHRQKEIYLSTGNSVTLYIYPQSNLTESTTNDRRFLLEFEAVGCSDVIPPEDAWLKRNDDTILIGCYSSRQTWQLTCNGGKWVGVLGNCSHETASLKTVVDLQSKSSISSEEQVLAIVAIGGCTLAICLTVICIGAVCLRRFYVKAKKKERCRTFNYSTNSAGRQQSVVMTLPGVASNYIEDDPTLQQMLT